MQLLNDSDETRQIFIRHLNDPKYPKPLKIPELLQQIRNLRYADLTSLIPQIGGEGKLMSQFLWYVEKHNCACWHSWQAAFKDFKIWFDTRA